MNFPRRCGVAGLLLCSFCIAAFCRDSPPAKAVNTATLFDFHSSFWVNLHQTLYRESSIARMPEARRQTLGLRPLSMADLTAEEAQAWNAAIAHYGRTFANKRLLFDPELIHINDALATQPDSPGDLQGVDLPAEYRAILRSAASVYRKHWWPEHDRANRDWIASTKALLDESAPTISTRLQDLFVESWPRQPVRVDVAYYVSEIGAAYTTDHPPHTTISSSSPPNQDLNGFEIVFHEASHTLSAKLESDLQTECVAQKKDCRDLWHVVLFYTVGQVVRTALAQHGQNDYVPYADHFGLYDRGDWVGYHRSVAQNWQPYIDGKEDWSTAVKALVAGLPAN